MTPNDDYVFIGDPPMERPESDEVHVSCAFTWDKEKAERLKLAWGQYYPIVIIGGCAYDDPCNGFNPGLYIRQGIVFTSRGCNNQCPWCEVWKREGKLRELDFVHQGNVIQDNNLLQCSKAHIQKVFQMLRQQHGIEFSGGLDSRLITDAVADDLRSLRVRQLFLACDTKEATRPLKKAVNRLGLSRSKLRCYVLLRFNSNETLSDATERLEMVWEAGCIPFAQLFQPPDKWIEYSLEWRLLAKLYSRPAATKAIHRDLHNIQCANVSNIA